MAAVVPGPIGPVLGPNGQPMMCKIELPSMGGGDEQYGGTRTINMAYVFSVDKQIGEGTYGQVFMGNDRKTQDKVALKKIRMDTEKEGFPITAIREIKILSTLQHDNVVNLREIVRSEIHKNNNYKGSIYMVFDYADYDLTGLMETVNYKFSIAQVKCIMKQLLKGLAYVHTNGVLHRDLKASNILIDSNGIVKLADFGLARTYQNRQEGRLTNRVITLWYRPPELLLGADRYGPEVDIWSVGCIFAELLVGKPIFPGKDEMDQLEQIFRITGSPNKTDWPGVERLSFYPNVPENKYKINRLRNWVRDQAAKNNVPNNVKDESAISLLEKMLALDPAKRISAVDAIKEPFFWQDPMPCEPDSLVVKGKSSHEFTMKKRRNEEKEAHAVAHAAQHAGRGGPHGGHGNWGGQQGGDPKRQRYGAPPPGTTQQRPQQPQPGPYPGHGQGYGGRGGQPQQGQYSGSSQGSHAPPGSYGNRPAAPPGGAAPAYGAPPAASYHPNQPNTGNAPYHAAYAGHHGQQHSGPQGQGGYHPPSNYNQSGAYAPAQPQAGMPPPPAVYQRGPPPAGYQQNWKQQR